MTGFALWTCTCVHPPSSAPPGAKATRPRPPMQISAMRRPASRPPRAAMPASTSVAPSGPAEQPSRSAVAAATSSVTRGAASALTLTGADSSEAGVMCAASSDHAPRRGAPPQDEFVYEVGPRVQLSLRFRARLSLGEHGQDRRARADDRPGARKVATPGGKRRVTGHVDRFASIDDTDRALGGGDRWEPRGKLGHRSPEAGEMPVDQSFAEVVVVQFEGRGRAGIDFQRRHPLLLEDEVHPGEPAQTGDANESVEAGLRLRAERGSEVDSPDRARIAEPRVPDRLQAKAVEAQAIGALAIGEKCHRQRLAADLTLEVSCATALISRAAGPPDVRSAGCARRFFEPAIGLGWRLPLRLGHAPAAGR